MTRAVSLFVFLIIETSLVAHVAIVRFYRSGLPVKSS
jgi:hypothetical protein